MEYEELLIEEGLSGWEARTYISLLKLGSTTTGPLTEKSQVPQSKIYVVLESLIKKGLASYIVKGKIKYFQASSPEIIASLTRDREKRLLEAIPQLKSMQEFSSKKQSVELFEGMKAITSLFVDLIESSKKGDEWMGFSVGEDDFLEKSQLFWNKIGALRAEKKLDVKIMNNQAFKEKYKTLYSDRWKFIKQIIKFSPSIFPSSTAIFNSKIIIINFLSSPETAVVISSKEMYNFYKDFFMHEWNKAKKAT